HASWGK
ncbi:copper/silver resistance outer membrane domain protein, partial [Vibrio parahaemolyticus V-223/04]